MGHRDKSITMKGKAFSPNWSIITKLLIVDASRPALGAFPIGLAHSRVRLQWLCQGPWLAGPRSDFKMGIFAPPLSSQLNQKQDFPSYRLPVMSVRSTFSAR